MRPNSAEAAAESLLRRGFSARTVIVFSIRTRPIVYSNSPPSLTLLEAVRREIRARHLSIRTEQQYVYSPCLSRLVFPCVCCSHRVLVGYCPPDRTRHPQPRAPFACLIGSAAHSPPPRKRRNPVGRSQRGASRRHRKAGSQATGRLGWTNDGTKRRTEPHKAVAPSILLLQPAHRRAPPRPAPARPAAGNLRQTGAR